MATIRREGFCHRREQKWLEHFFLTRLLVCCCYVIVLRMPVLNAFVNLFMHREITP